MIEITVRAKSWGNSVGVVLPKNTGIKPKEELKLHIERTTGFTKVEDIFGTAKFKRTTAELLEEVDRELDIGE